jgi:hypothetical protein
MTDANTPAKPVRGLGGLAAASLLAARCCDAVARVDAVENFAHERLRNFMKKDKEYGSQDIETFGQICLGGLIVYCILQFV